MWISEIFYSLQGESSFSGYPFIFVRLSGCPLRCCYCDSSYAWEKGEEQSIEEILTAVRAYGPHPVLLTGGEPLLQAEVYELIRLLLEDQRTVLVETCGSLSIGKLDPRVITILDVKCPGSGEVEKNDWSNLSLLREQDEVKFVLCHREDYRFACEILSRYRLPGRCKVLFSAAQGFLQPQELASWILRDHLPVRLQLQLHKILWPGLERGV